MKTAHIEILFEGTWYPWCQISAFQQILHVPARVECDTINAAHDAGCPLVCAHCNLWEAQKAVSFLIRRFPELQGKLQAVEGPCNRRDFESYESIEDAY